MPIYTHFLIWGVKSSLWGELFWLTAGPWAQHPATFLLDVEKFPLTNFSNLLEYQNKVGKSSRIVFPRHLTLVYWLQDAKDARNMNFKKTYPALLKTHFSVLSYTEKWPSFLDELLTKLSWNSAHINIFNTNLAFSVSGLP